MYREGNQTFCSVAISTAVQVNPQLLGHDDAPLASQDIQQLMPAESLALLWTSQFPNGSSSSPFSSLLTSQQQGVSTRDLFFPLHQKVGLSFDEAELNTGVS